MRNRTTKTQQRGSNPLPSDVLMTLPDLGIDVEKVTKSEAWALCPSPKHHERSASWSINLDTGEHNCFSCGWGGNYEYLVKQVKRLDTEQAEEWIRKRGGIAVALKKLQGVSGWTKKQAEEVTEADLALFDELIPMWALKERDVIQEACEAYGVLWNPDNDAWIFPVREPESQRLLGWQEKSKKDMKNHPFGLEKAGSVFGYHLLGEDAYVEESPLDCPRLWTYSVDGGVSGYGVHISDLQMDLIVEHPKVKRVIMCLDNDKAGRTKEAEIWANYRHRTRLYFANYDGIDAKDHGDMSPDEIAFSIENPISALRYRPC
jgi:DNA primase